MNVLRETAVAVALLAVAVLPTVHVARADIATDAGRAFAAARALQDEGKLEAAMAAYRELIRRHPEEVAAYNNLAVLLARKGELDEARRVLVAGLQTSESYATIYRNLNAITLEQARESYLKALRLGETPKPPELALLDAPATTASAQVTPPLAAATARPAESGGETAPPPARAAAEAVAIAPPANRPVTSEEARGDGATLAAAPDLTRAVVDPLATRREEIIDALQAWAAAWSARDADIYLSFYSDSFIPAGGVTRARWARQRRQRLVRPRWIKVSLEDIRIEVADDFHAVVRLRQDYRSDTYHDVTLKRLTLKHESDGWRIAREQNLRTLQ